MAGEAKAQAALAIPGLTTGERLIIVAIAAGGSPKQLGAIAAAAARATLATSSGHPADEQEAEDQAVEDEVALRQSSLQPFLVKQVAAGAAGQKPRISGHMRATRNIAVHNQLGGGVQELAQALDQPQRAQRGHGMAKLHAAIEHLVARVDAMEEKTTMSETHPEPEEETNTALDKNLEDQLATLQAEVASLKEAEKQHQQLHDKLCDTIGTLEKQSIKHQGDIAQQAIQVDALTGAQLETQALLEESCQHLQEQIGQQQNQANQPRRRQK